VIDLSICQSEQMALPSVVGIQYYSTRQTTAVSYEGMLKAWQAAMLSLFPRKKLIDQPRVDMLKGLKYRLCGTR